MKKRSVMGFREIIVFFVFSIYLVFAFVVFFYYNSYYSKNLKERLESDNRYSAKVIKDLIEEDKLRMLSESRSLGASDNVFMAFNHNSYVTINWKYMKDTYIVESRDMNKLNYRLLANAERNRLYGKGRGSEEKGIAIYSINGEFLGMSDYYDKEFINTGEEKYLKDVTLDNNLGGVEITVIQKKGDKFGIKVLTPIGKNARFFYDDNPKGVIEVFRALDKSYIDRLGRIVNKEILLMDEKKVYLSTIYEEGFNIESINPVELLKGTEHENTSREEYFDRMLETKHKKYAFTFMKIKDYEGKVLGYLGVGDDLGSLEGELSATMGKFIRYQILATIILMVILYFVLYVLFKPMKQLIKRIKFIEEGNYRQRMDIQCTGEIKLLADSINRLAEEVEKREESLKELNLTLETKVAHRTLELEHSLKDLRTIAMVSNNIHISGNVENVIEDILEIIYSRISSGRAVYFKYNNEEKRLVGFSYIGEISKNRLVTDLEIDIAKKPLLADLIYKKMPIRLSNKNGEILDEFEENLYFIPIDYEDSVFGVIAIGSESMIDEDDYVFNIIKKSLSIYLNNDYLSKERTKSDKLNAIINLLKSIVHEIKTPLVGIKGFSNMILNRLKKVENESDLSKIKKENTKIAEYTSIILQESERIDAMAIDLLDYASRNEVHDKYDVVNLFEFVQDIATEFQSIQMQENVKVFTEVPHDIFINAYKVQLKKIFTNLIKNSIEAKKGSENDEIVIKAELIDSDVVIKIRDNGQGIEKEKLEKIFEPLVTTKIQGTGLGLTIVKDIVEKHMGKISVNSEKGVFTEFTIILPVVE